MASYWISFPGLPNVTCGRVRKDKAGKSTITTSVRVSLQRMIRPTKSRSDLDVSAGCMMEMASVPPFGLGVRIRCQPPGNSETRGRWARPTLPGLVASTAEAGAVANAKTATKREKSIRDVAIFQCSPFHAIQYAMNEINFLDPMETATPMQRHSLECRHPLKGLAVSGTLFSFHCATWSRSRESFAHR